MYCIYGRFDRVQEKCGKQSYSSPRRTGEEQRSFFKNKTCPELLDQKSESLKIWPVYTSQIYTNLQKKIFPGAFVTMR